MRIKGLYSLRESTNRMSQLTIVDGAISVTDDLKYTSENILKDLSGIVHERDKLGAIHGKDILGIDERRENHFFIVNTSKKNVDDNSILVVVKDLTFQLKERDDTEEGDIVVGELVTELRFKNLTSFARF